MALNTPIVMDTISRSLVPSFDERETINLNTLGQSVFGNPANGSQTFFTTDQAAFDYEITRGNERLAALVPRGTNGRYLGSDNTQSHRDVQDGQSTYVTRKFPLIEEEASLPADLLLNRNFGESPFSDRTRAERFRVRANALYKEKFRRIVRLDDYLAFQVLLTGKQPALLYNTTDVYDFRRATANTVTAGATWAAGTPLTDIDSLADQIQAAGKIAPDAILLGGVALSRLLANTQLTTTYANKMFYDLVRFEAGFQPDQRYARLVAAGAIPFGKLRTPKGYDFVVFTYNRVYTSAAGVATKYMPDNSAILFSTQARFDRFFGPPEVLPPSPAEEAEFMFLMGFNPNMPNLPGNIHASGGIIEPATFFVDFYKWGNKKGATLRVQHAPVFVPTQTDAIGVLNGL